MTLYLLRHAIAVDEEDFTGEDSDRPLTEEGRRKMEKVARGMKNLGVHFDALISSPFVRARETAEIVSAVFHCKDHPEYYALVGGKRKLDEHGGGPQLCMSNPELVSVVVDAVLAEIKKNPTARNINIAQMDNESYCTCQRCAEVDTQEESHAGATLAFVNAVAEKVEKTHPESC